ncbi:hypothetical protein [Phenylobacterium sp.]|uniref:hypothetical protein n=1 Tax=Phenylobacterium sp. TaxID=1871053 RepID=UPI00286BC384|nr:hypothetical protein [Phenylobacterium sp.]
MLKAIIVSSVVLALASCSKTINESVQRRCNLMSALRDWVSRTIGHSSAKKPNNAFIVGPTVLQVRMTPPRWLRKAAIGACSDLLARTAQAWRQMSSGQTMVSYRTGSAVTAEARTYEEMTMKAQFYVVQARAGHCAIPD